MALSTSPGLSIATPQESFDTDSSMLFDGTDDRITTSADSTLATKTYSFWAKSTKATLNSVFSHGDYQTGAFHLNFGSSVKPILYMNVANFRYWESTELTAAQDDGNWHHYLVSIVQGDITASKLYLDGVEQPVQSTFTSGIMNAYTTGIQIGGTSQNSFFFDGSLDEFAIFNGDQTDKDFIRELYNNGRPTNLLQYSTLDHWYRMGEGKLGTKSDGESNLLFQGITDLRGPELVTNGNFSTSSSWNVDTNASITGGKLVLSGSSGLSYQSINLEDFAVYEVSFTVSNYSSGTVRSIRPARWTLMISR